MRAGHRPALLAGPVASPSVASPAAGSQVVVERIVDGDTIEVDRGGEQTVRIIGYDAPETGGGAVECGGREATAALRGMIPPGSTVRLEADQELRDRYGRLLRYVYTADGQLVSTTMVLQGYAEALLIEPNDRHIEAVRQAEAHARWARRGIWGPPCNNTTQ